MVQSQSKIGVLIVFQHCVNCNMKRSFNTMMSGSSSPDAMSEQTSTEPRITGQRQWSSATSNGWTQWYENDLQHQLFHERMNTEMDQIFEQARKRMRMSDQKRQSQHQLQESIQMQPFPFIANEHNGSLSSHAAPPDLSAATTPATTAMIATFPYQPINPNNVNTSHSTSTDISSHSSHGKPIVPNSYYANNSHQMSQMWQIPQMQNTQHTQHFLQSQTTQLTNPMLPSMQKNAMANGVGPDIGVQQRNPRIRNFCTSRTGSSNNFSPIRTYARGIDGINGTSQNLLAIATQVRSKTKPKANVSMIANHPRDQNWFQTNRRSNEMHPQQMRRDATTYSMRDMMHIRNDCVPLRWKNTHETPPPWYSCYLPRKPKRPTKRQRTLPIPSTPFDTSESHFTQTSDDSGPHPSAGSVTTRITSNGTGTNTNNSNSTSGTTVKRNGSNNLNKSQSRMCACDRCSESERTCSEMSCANGSSGVCTDTFQHTSGTKTSRFSANSCSASGTAASTSQGQFKIDSKNATKMNKSGKKHVQKCAKNKVKVKHGRETASVKVTKQKRVKWTHAENSWFEILYQTHRIGDNINWNALVSDFHSKFPFRTRSCLHSHKQWYEIKYKLKNNHFKTPRTRSGNKNKPKIKKLSDRNNKKSNTRYKRKNFAENQDKRYIGISRVHPSESQTLAPIAITADNFVGNVSTQLCCNKQNESGTEPIISIDTPRLKEYRKEFNEKQSTRNKATRLSIYEQLKRKNSSTVDDHCSTTVKQDENPSNNSKTRQNAGSNATGSHAANSEDCARVTSKMYTRKYGDCIKSELVHDAQNQKHENNICCFVFELDEFGANRVNEILKEWVIGGPCRQDSGSTKFVRDLIFEEFGCKYHIFSDYKCLLNSFNAFGAKNNCLILMHYEFDFASAVSSTSTDHESKGLPSKVPLGLAVPHGPLSGVIQKDDLMLSLLFMFVNIFFYVVCFESFSAKADSVFDCNCQCTCPELSKFWCNCV